VLLNKKGKTYSIYVIPFFQVWKGVFSSNTLHVEQTYTNIIIWRVSRFQPLFSQIVCRSNIHIIHYLGTWCPLWAQVSHKCYSIKSWNKLTPFTSFLVIHVSKRVLNSTTLHAEQTNTNIIIWRESRPYLALIVRRSNILT
jgi:hypothetical protein